MIAPRVLDEDAIAELAAQMRQPDQRRADLRAQLAADRVGGAAARSSCTSGSAPTTLRAGVRRRCSTTPSGARAPASRRSPTARAPRATCSRRARATSRSRSRATVDGRAADARLHRQRGAARRQPQLPAGRDPLGLLLRDARADRPRHPAERRRLPAGRGDRARGLPAQRALARRGRRRQRRDLLARRRPRAAARSGARSARAR